MLQAEVIQEVMAPAKAAMADRLEAQMGVRAMGVRWVAKGLFAPLIVAQSVLLRVLRVLTDQGVQIRARAQEWAVE